MQNDPASLVEKLTRAIQDSPIRLMSEEEIANGTQLADGEFLARAKAFIKDPESGIPGGKDAEVLTVAILAKQHRRRLSADSAKAWMAPLFPVPTHHTPTKLNQAQKAAVLKKAFRQISEPMPPKKTPVKTVKAKPKETPSSFAPKTAPKKRVPKTEGYPRTKKDAVKATTPLPGVVPPIRTRRPRKAP